MYGHFRGHCVTSRLYGEGPKQACNLQKNIEFCEVEGKGRLKDPLTTAILNVNNIAQIRT
jgi:hypothetical protein